VPELPEVESIRRKLEPRLIGRTISAVKLILPRIVEKPSSRLFTKGLLNRKITKSHRIGKYLFFELDNGKFLHFHLRMTGRLLLSKTHPQYACISFLLDNGMTLWYCDSRTLGRVALYPKIPDAVKSMTDAVNDNYDAMWLYEKLKSRSTPIKDVLLDQHFLAGIGNIYACEICFRSRISPYRLANKVKRKEAEPLYQAIKQVMDEAIKAEGTTFSDFRGADGKPGNYQLQLAVYDRLGEHCLVCKTPIVKKQHHGRGTYHCPHCQK
jgi:formamidopyrimidine-DNA glycosylase